VNTVLFSHLSAKLNFLNPLASIIEWAVVPRWPYSARQKSEATDFASGFGVIPLQLPFADMTSMTAILRVLSIPIKNA
jgi:hypothetical protein